MRKALHERDLEMAEIFRNLKGEIEKLEPSMNETKKAGNLTAYLVNYINQIENFLHIISTSRRGDWEGYLAAAKDHIKYLSVHDLLHYARLMPVHIAQIRKLKEEDPETWQHLKVGGFSV